MVRCFAFVCDSREQRVSTEKGYNADHDQILQGGEHVQLQPEAVVQAKDGGQAGVETDAGERERHVGHVDADLQPTDEHEEDGGQAEQGECVGDDGGWTNFRFTELVADFRLGNIFGNWCSL